MPPPAQSSVARGGRGASGPRAGGGGSPAPKSRPGSRGPSRSRANSPGASNSADARGGRGASGSANVGRGRGTSSSATASRSANGGSSQGAASSSANAAGGRGASGGAASDSADVGEIRALFKQLDTDKNGSLSYEEIRGWLTHLNPKFSEKDVQKLFLEIDVDKNGSIQVDEFIDYVFYAKKSNPTVQLEPPRGEISGAKEVPGDWKQATLDAHNELRALHGVPPLAWDDDCYRNAKLQADVCQAKGALIHGFPLDFRHGQNIFWSSMPGSSARYAARCWHYEMERPGWDFANPPFRTTGCGHFTAVVWKSTTHVGMATSEDGCFIVANYSPPGNLVGHAAENVFPILDSMRPKYEAILKDRNASVEVDLPPDGAPSDPKRQPQKTEEKAKEDPAPSQPEQPPQKPECPWLTAEKTEKVTASSMTPELEALFEGCPFKSKDQVTAAFAEGEASVCVTRAQNGDTTLLEVAITTIEGNGFLLKRSRCAWGCADR